MISGGLGLPVTSLGASPNGSLAQIFPFGSLTCASLRKTGYFFNKSLTLRASRSLDKSLHQCISVTFAHLKPLADTNPVSTLNRNTTTPV